MKTLLRFVVIILACCSIAGSAAAQLKSTKTSIDFGSVRALTSKVDSFYVRNDSSFAQTLTGATAGNSRFTITGNLAAVLNFRDSTVIRVSFRPELIGTFNDTVTVTHSSPSGNRTVKVALVGRGVDNIRFLNARTNVAITSLAMVDTFATHTRLDSILIVNDASNIITVSAITFSNSEFQVLSSYPFLLQTGVAQKIRFSYRASSVGRDIDTLRIYHDDPAQGSSPLRFPISARGRGTLDFSLGGVILDNRDTVRVNAANNGARNGSLNPAVAIDSARLVLVTVTNVGLSPINVTSISVTGPNFQNITPANYTHNVGVAYDRIVRLFYQPKTLSALQVDSLVLTTNDTIPGGNRMVLRLEGSSQRQIYLRSSANVTSLAFGNVPLNSSSTLVARLYNYRDQATTIDSVSFAARDPKYSFVSATKLTLAQGDTSLINVKFAPTDTLATLTSTHPDTLLVYSTSVTGSPLRLPLTGTVTLSIVFNPNVTAIAFGPVRSGGVVDSSIKVYNFTSTNYQIDSVSFRSGKNYFVLSNALKTTLNARDSTTIRLRFQPITVGQLLDTLLIYHNFPTTLVANPRKVAVSGVLTTQSLINAADYITVDNAIGGNVIDGFPASSADQSYVETGPFWTNTSGFGGTHRRSPNLAGSPNGSSALYTFKLDSSSAYLVYHFMVQSPNAGTGQFLQFRKFGVGGVIDSMRYNLLDNNSSFFGGGTWLPLTMHYFDGVGAGAASVTLGADAQSGQFLRVDGMRMLRSRQKADIEFGRRDINFGPVRVPEEFPQITLGDEFVRNYRLYNLGRDTLVITNVRLLPQLTPVPWFTVKNFTPGTPIKIPPMKAVGTVEQGGYFDLQLSFSPFQEGFARDSLIISSNDENEADAAISLYGEGINYNFIMNASSGNTEPHFRAPSPPDVPVIPIYRETGAFLNSAASPYVYPIRGGNTSSRVNVNGATTLPHLASYDFQLPDLVAGGKIRSDGSYILEYSGPVTTNGFPFAKAKVTHSFGVPKDSAYFSENLITSVANWVQVGGTAKTFFMSPGGKITVDLIRDADTDAKNNNGTANFLRADFLRVRKVPTGALIGVDVATTDTLRFGNVDVRNPAGIDGKANKKSVLIGSRGESQLIVTSMRLRGGTIFRLTTTPTLPSYLRAVNGELSLAIEFLPKRIATVYVDTLEIRSNSTRDSVLFVPLIGTGVGTTFTTNDDGAVEEVASIPAFGGLYDAGWDKTKLTNWQLESSITDNQIGIGKTRRRLPIYLNPTGARFEWFPLFPAVQGSGDSIYVQVIATMQPGQTKASPRARYRVYAAGGTLRVDTLINQTSAAVGPSGLGEYTLGSFYFLRGSRDVANQPPIFGHVRVENDTAAVNKYYRDLNQINAAQRDTFSLVADAIIFREVSATGTITGVTTANNSIPREFALSQNYPNPFNPTTTINFSLPEAVRVDLRIYDILGREVATLIDNQDIVAGNHRIQWNGKNQGGMNVATGMYFYRIVAGGFVQAKKMVLIK